MGSVNIDNLIDELIGKERQVAPNPFLAKRILSKIEDKTIESVWMVRPVWATIVIACTFAAVIFGGTVLGKQYQISPNIVQTLSVDDSQIENISYYRSLIHE